MATEQATLENTENPEVTTQTLEIAPTQEPNPESKAFDPATLSPEAKAYFDKQLSDTEGKYKDYERFKGMSQEYEGLLRTKEFQEWYQSQRSPRAPEKFELSDEQFTAALSDKGQFQNLVTKLAERIADQKYGPKIQATEARLEISQRTDELNKSVRKHDGSDGLPAFMDLDKRGFIEPYLRQYPGISFEHAYNLALSHVLPEVVDKKARGLVDSKKSAGAERPSAGNGGRGSKVRVKSTEEAMELAYEAAKAGRPEPDFEFE